MVRKLRSGAKLGLLYGQGGFVTKHHALVLSPNAPRSAIAQDTSVQTEADGNRRPTPPYVIDASGSGKVESFTVLYGRKGDVEHGLDVVLRDHRIGGGACDVGNTTEDRRRRGARRGDRQRFKLVQ